MREEDNTNAALWADEEKFQKNLDDEINKENSSCREKTIRVITSVMFATAMTLYIISKL